MSYVGPPPGTVFQFAGSSAPTGYLICDGSSVLRATYVDLFAVIGVIYGSVDGTHFNLPDGQGRILTGLGTNAEVNALNKSDGLVVGSRKITHTHDTVLPSSGAGPGSSASLVSAQTLTSSANGSAFLVINHIIKF